ncbi:MAG: hypothetical protein ABSF64_34910 [Bryobacteraceae bacterium]
MSVLLAMAAAPLAAQNLTEQQYITSVNTAMNNLVPTLGTPTQPIIIGGNLVGAYGTKIANMDLSVVLDWVDGLKAAGVQRIEFNPSMATLTHPDNVTKYDAIVRHIRELGLQLAINPEYEVGEIDPSPITNFAEFQTQALAEYQELASRYQPDNFVIIHEPDTASARLGFTTTISDWQNFILAAAPIVKAASPHTRVGAGCDYNPALSTYQSEAAYFQSFVTMPELDFMTMDIYSTAFDQFAQWAQLAQTNGKGVYIEEVWTPFDLPNPLGPWNGEPLADRALIGPVNADFASMDANWLHGMMLFASANHMEAMTAFTTEAFFFYGPAGEDTPDNTAYQSADEQAMQQGQLSTTGQAFLADSRQMGVQRLTNISSASYATLPTVFNPTCGAAANPCNPQTRVAPDSLMSAFGVDLATGSVLNGAFPTTLGGTTMTLVDATNTSYPVQMYYAGPSQVNYYVPGNAQPGPATVTVTSGDGTQTTGNVLVAPVAPGLFTANASGQGAASALAICAGVCTGWPNRQANGQYVQDAFTCSGSAGCAPQPLGMGSSDTVVVEFFGTGFRHISSPAALTVQINGQNVPYQYAGAQGDTGLDQLNVQLPNSLAGSGVVTLVVTVQDTVDNVTVTSNSVTLNIQ